MIRQNSDTEKSLKTKISVIKKIGRQLNIPNIRCPENLITGRMTAQDSNQKNTCLTDISLENSTEQEKNTKRISLTNNIAQRIAI